MEGLLVLIFLFGITFWVLIIVGIVFFVKKVLPKIKLDQYFPQLKGLIDSYKSLPEDQKARIKMQIVTMLMQASNRMSQINDLSRQKYETNLGEIQGMAASAGIDWHAQ
jgi:hypothetical protein